MPVFFNIDGFLPQCGISGQMIYVLLPLTIDTMNKFNCPASFEKVSKFFDVKRS